MICFSSRLFRLPSSLRQSCTRSFWSLLPKCGAVAPFIWSNSPELPSSEWLDQTDFTRKNCRIWLLALRNDRCSSRCWWFRNPANQLRLVVYPITFRVLYIPSGAGFLSSRVSVVYPRNYFFLSISSTSLYLKDGWNTWLDSFENTVDFQRFVHPFLTLTICLNHGSQTP